MVLELISSRIVAPLIGSSLYTWTSVIGITLLGLACGTFLGGRVADKSGHRALSYAFLISALTVSVIPYLAPLTKYLITFTQDVLILNLLVTCFLFLLPTILLGSLQPILVGHYLKNTASPGKTYSVLSTVWSLGSMCGVFVTGFLLLSYLGSKEIILILALLLVGISLLFIERTRTTILVTGLCIACIVGLFLSNPSYEKSFVFHKETPYYDAKVVDMDVPGYGPSRALFLDFDLHSLEPRNKGVENYTTIQTLFGYLNNNIHNVLVLGAGAYSLPKHFAHEYPRANVNVMELDPTLVTIGQKFFNLDTQKVNTLVGDAKILLPQSTQNYDVIFGDTYNSLISVPWYLLTQEWNEGVKTKLTERGVYAINFIGIPEGRESLFAQSVIATFAATFPNYYVYYTDQNSYDVQNIVLIGLKTPLSQEEEQVFLEKISKNSTLSGRLEKSHPIEGAQILTDNFSPTEKLMTPVIKNYYPKNLAFRLRAY